MIFNMKYFYYLIFLFGGSFEYASASENLPVMVNTFSYNVCNAAIVFENKVKQKKQTIKLNDKVSMNLHQYRTDTRKRGAKIASNVICQRLTGAEYSGSDEEWAAFIQNAADGLKKAKAKDIQLFLIGDKVKVYSSLADNKEYDFRATFGGNRQIIKNIAVLDRLNNTVYTLSVSGADRVRNEVNEEFERLVKSFRLKSQ